MADCDVCGLPFVSDVVLEDDTEVAVCCTNSLCIEYGKLAT